ncbi:MAG: carboxypeptidase regulatory-like domain-containing protein, partial [Bacteroidota bacterium]
MKKTLLTLLTFMACCYAFSQGVTTASMNGRIVDTNGEPLIGATIIATHTPTGVEWGNVSDLDGFFRLNNLNVGGPYTIVVTYVGFETQQKSNVFLSLGQKLKVNFELSESATALSEVVVSANQGAIIDGNRTGASTFIDLQSINTLPNVGRSVGDFVRLTPQASIEEGNDGLSISIGGQNNRYNAIYIDGAVNNDVFGLAGSGTNGGQTGVSPISIDAIEQFNVNVAPFDVRQSGFAGGSISAVTRSGSNEFEGSIYHYFRNEKIAGKTPLEDGQQTQERDRLAEFSAQTTGFRIGGPVIKNKLFFFINGEIQRDETPQPFNFDNYQGNVTQENLVSLRNFVSTQYGYDIGSFDNNTAFLDSDKFLAKIDYNLNQNHKITLRHSYTKAENLEARRSTATGISFSNGSEFFVSETHSSALELKSSLGNKISNNLTLGATFVRDDRDPFGDPFPAVFIDDGRGGIRFGAETFSTANRLDQDIITINNNLEYYAGRHTFIVGANVELYRTLNLFIPFNFGDY